MNDTIINQRQEIILQILKNKGNLSRAEVAKILIGNGKNISKITLIRDLNLLKKHNFISSNGEARFTKYFILNKNPLLEYVDINEYFLKEVDDRKIKNNFNSDFFGQLNNLYTKDETKIWTDASGEFIKRSKVLDKSIYKRELERFIVEFSWKSSQIEGNTYDLLETETLLIQNIEAKGHSKEEAIMLINHKNAFGLILKEKNTFKNIKYADVLQLHGVLTKNLITSGIRNQPVRISGTNYIPLTSEHDLETNLRKLIDVINKIDFPADKALVASSVLAYIQPFKDGNKRTARTLANAILLAHDYFPLSYRNLDLNEYRKALILFYEQNNLFHLKRILISQIKYAVDNYFRI